MSEPPSGAATRTVPGKAAAAVLVTGAAGFIGFHLARALLGAGRRVIGVDSITPYYDGRLKRARLDVLGRYAGFAFEEFDLADDERTAALVAKTAPDVVVHLAAQAGVRYSLEAPMTYVHANGLGHLSVLEACRRARRPPFLVYASSSSVYGGSRKALFHEDDPVDAPESLYAATKRAAELMSGTYARLYGLNQIGVRFFTVYGPWGRPDMAYWKFTEAILSGRPIEVFNGGDLWRDFTFIDDVVAGLMRMVDRGPLPGDPPHWIFNLGNNCPVRLDEFVATLEEVLGRKAIRVDRPMQPGDVYRTAADIDRARRVFGFEPRTRIREGLAAFAHWYVGEWRSREAAA